MKSKKMQRRFTLSVSVAVVVFLSFFALAATVSSTDFPTKPVVIVCPFNPGGSTDMWHRILAAAVVEHLGQSVIVDNKGGASGTIGANYVANAAPDGYTLLGGTIGPFTLQPILADVPYSNDDFRAIVQVVAGEHGIAVHTDAPWETFLDVVDYARENPGALRIGITGIGGSAHLVSLDLARTLDIDVVFVPFDGAGDTVAALVGKHIDLATAVPAGFTTQIEAGALRGIATFSEGRLSYWPDVPSLLELGIDVVYEGISHGGVFAPRDTPDEIVAILEAAFLKALLDPATKETMERQGLDYYPLPAAEYEEKVRDLDQRFRVIVDEMLRN